MMKMRSREVFDVSNDFLIFSVSNTNNNCIVIFKRNNASKINQYKNFFISISFHVDFTTKDGLGN